MNINPQRPLNIRAIAPNLMPFGILPLAIGWASQYFEPAFTGHNTINIQAMSRPSRLLADRRLANRMITFGTDGGLPDEQINILYNPWSGLNQISPPEYEACLRAMVWSSWSVFWDLRDMYFFLLHLLPATRARIRGIIIHDITRGPYTKEALRLLKGCTNLRWMRIHLCPTCGDLRAPTGKFNHWQKLARGIGRLSRSSTGLTIRSRKPLEWCDKCRTMARPGQPPPLRAQGQMDNRKAILRRYLLRSRQ